ncbi:hypothetical protein C8F04DRAFT_1186912 [Mycena alexandri]|uniref:Uncharacterized protein n=1 Tax=Mycena alexandri TaxID=1745969 RepID=A0AAD6SNL6_9AGAR|nr:hypothetical protein C8F04DRAFT_1186912 [Mycena alexandri]
MQKEEGRSWVPRDATATGTQYERGQGFRRGVSGVRDHSSWIEDLGDGCVFGWLLSSQAYWLAADISPKFAQARRLYSASAATERRRIPKWPSVDADLNPPTFYRLHSLEGYPTQGDLSAGGLIEPEASVADLNIS